mgnify:CR=1 FL=1
MIKRRRSTNRRGAVLVETAIVLPVTILLLLGTMVAGLGVFRYNQIAYLTRLGARWASVHGPNYQTDQKKSAPTAADVMAGAVTPYLSGINAGDLTPTLTWNTGATPATVTFRLSYRWLPEISYASFLPKGATTTSAVTLSSTSTQLITY